jgi:hypothetical protein
VSRIAHRRAVLCLGLPIGLRLTWPGPRDPYVDTSRRWVAVSTQLDGGGLNGLSCFKSWYIAKLDGGRRW